MPGTTATRPAGAATSPSAVPANWRNCSRNALPRTRNATHGWPCGSMPTPRRSTSCGLSRRLPERFRSGAEPVVPARPRHRRTLSPPRRSASRSPGQAGNVDDVLAALLIECAADPDPDREFARTPSAPGETLFRRQPAVRRTELDTRVGCPGYSRRALPRPRTCGPIPGVPGCPGNRPDPRGPHPGSRGTASADEPSPRTGAGPRGSTAHGRRRRPARHPHRHRVCSSPDLCADPRSSLRIFRGHWTARTCRRASRTGMGRRLPPPRTPGPATNPNHRSRAPLGDAARRKSWPATR